MTVRILYAWLNNNVPGTVVGLYNMLDYLDTNHFDLEYANHVWNIDFVLGQFS